MRRAVLILAVALGAAAVFASRAQAGYVGDRTTKKYHRLKCPRVRQIKPENVVYFKTILNAFRSGYTPCRHCLQPHPARWRKPVKAREQEKVPLHGEKRRHVHRLRPKHKARRVKNAPRTLTETVFDVPANRSWMDTGVCVPDGAGLEIRASGNILDKEPRSIWQRSGPWDPDGLNPFGKPNHDDRKKQLYYLQGKIAGRKIRLGSRFAATVKRGGRLFIRVKDKPSACANNRGILTIEARVLEPLPPKPTPDDKSPPKKESSGKGKKQEPRGRRNKPAPKKTDDAEPLPEITNKP